MKTRITILAILFVLFNIFSLNAFDKQERNKPGHNPFPEMNKQKEQYPPGFKEMNADGALRLMKKGDAVQSNPDYLVDSVQVFNEIGFDKRYVFAFYENKQMLTETESTWRYNKWITNKRYTNTYDEAGNLLTRLTEIWKNEEWVDYYRYTYIYDEVGNLLTLVSEIWINEEWKNEFRNTYTYDEAGNQHTMQLERWYSEWVNDYRYTYTYDEDGNQLTRLRETWQNEEWVIRYQYTFSYDETGNQLTYLREYWQNEEWVNSSSWINTFNKDGNLLTSLGKTWQNEEWVNDYRYTYSYDEAGNRLTRLYAEWQNEKWVIFMRYSYNYDENSNLIIWLSEFWQNEEWIEFDNSFSFKDSNGNSYGSYRGYKFEITWSKVSYSVSTESLSKGYCQGDTIAVTYTAPRTFNEGNVFTAELSDASGDFTNPVEIGTLDAVSSGIIEAVIPRSTEAGTAYRIRVVASGPVTLGDDNGGDISIYLIPPKSEITREEDKLISSSPAGNQWFLDGELIAGATEQSYNTNQVAGIYTVQVTSENGCVSDMSEPYDFISGIQDEFVVKEMSIYPNPFSQFTIINYELTIPGNVALNIYNNLGIKITTLVNEYQSAGSHLTVFNAANHPDGMYYYNIQIGERTEKGKLLLIR